MRFLEPEAAYWLLLLPGLWCCWLLHRWNRERARRLSWVGPQLLKLAALAGGRRDLVVLAFATFGALALVAAATRPQIVVRTPEYERIDLILVLDRSASMRTTDIQPSRFGRARLEIQNFLMAAPEAIGRVGLIAFADSAVVLSYLTWDPGVLFIFLELTDEDQVPHYGTDLGRALQSALDLAHEDLPQRRKVIVLISDGDDQGSELDRVVADLLGSRIPVYSIGIGGKAEVAIPAPPWTEHAMLQDDSGAVLTTRFNEGALRRIAGMTQGRYFRSVTGMELTRALADITARETEIAEWRDDYRDLHGLALAVAALAFSGLVVALWP